MEEEFPLLGNSSAAKSAPSASASNATSSVHLRVNAKKGGAAGNSRGAGRGGGVVLHYSQNAGDSKAKGNKNSSASIVSKSGNNITLKSKAKYTGGNKENSSSLGDFPSLGHPNRTLSHPFGGPDLYSTGQSQKFTPLASNVTVTKASSSKNKEYRSNGFQKPPSANDFPSLSSDSGTKNYQGMSKVTVPVNNSWTKSTDRVPAASAAKPPSADSAKNKKKKNVTVQQPSPAVTSAPSSHNKKRQLRLNNVFDDSDEEMDEPNYGVTFASSRRDYDVYNHVSHVPEVSSSMKVLPAESFEAKKKSELKIGSLKNSVPKLNSSGAFPSLGGGKKSSNFNNDDSMSESWANKSSSSKKNAKNTKNQNDNFSNTDMTFHNSYGESYQVSAANNNKSANSKTSGKNKEKSKHKFLQPADFEQRNQQLIKTISNHCGEDSQKYKKFKSLATSLRNKDVEGSSYYQECKQLMGKSTFWSILPELLGLLPDIGMQQVGIYYWFSSGLLLSTYSLNNSYFMYTNTVVETYFISVGSQYFL